MRGRWAGGVAGCELLLMMICCCCSLLSLCLPLHLPGRPACLPSRQVLAKAEFLNPGGSVKDRVALEIIQVWSLRAGVC